MVSAPPVITATGRASALADRLALVLSVILSPFLLTPVFCALLVGNAVDSWSEFWTWVSVAIFFSSAVPCGYIIYNVRTGRITDLHVRLLEQRTGPFVAGVIGLTMLAVVLWLFDGPDLLTQMTTVTLVNGVIFALISRRWKISVHTGVLSCCLGGGRELLGWGGYWFFLLQPPLIWARARRKRHHVCQGSLGALLAYGMTSFGLRLLRGGL